LETQHHDLSRGTRSRSRSSSVSASLRDLDDEERETDTEGDVASDDDASSVENNSDFDQDEEQPDGAEYALLSVAGEDSDDEDDEEDVSAAALLGLDSSAVALDGFVPHSEDADNDVEMIEEEGDGSPAVDEPSAAPFDDGLSPHSDLVATPSTDPLPGSPGSLVPSARPLVLSPAADMSPPALPPAAHPFSEVLLSVKEDFHPVCKTPAEESQVADMAADSLTLDHDLLAHEVHVEQKPSRNGDLIITGPQELDLTPQPTPVTYDSETERPDFPTSGESQTVPDIESATPVADDDDAASAVGDEFEEDTRIPRYLKPYAAAPVEWDSTAVIKPPALLRGILRPYQQAGLEWLASIHARNLNCILADEMGLGCVFLLFCSTFADLLLGRPSRLSLF
jgi:helicase SWR1